MLLYPELPLARTRVVVVDLLVLLALLVGLVLADRAHDAVDALAEPALAVEGTAVDVAADLARPVDIPLIGDALRRPLDALAASVRRVGEAAASQAAAARRAADVTRVLVLLPVAAVVGLRVWQRRRWWRRAADARRARATPGGLALLAMRAATTAPLPQVLRATGGAPPLDPVCTAPLAALALAQLGLRGPRPPGEVGQPGS